MILEGGGLPADAETPLPAEYHANRQFCVVLCATTAGDLICLSHDGTKSRLFGLAGGSPRRSSNDGKSESVDPTVCPRHPDCASLFSISCFLYWFGLCSRSRLLTKRFLNSSTGPTF